MSAFLWGGPKAPRYLGVCRRLEGQRSLPRPPHPVCPLRCLLCVYACWVLRVVVPVEVWDAYDGHVCASVWGERLGSLAAPVSACGWMWACIWVGLSIPPVCQVLLDVFVSTPCHLSRQSRRLLEY